MQNLVSDSLLSQLIRMFVKSADEYAESSKQNVRKVERISLLSQLIRMFVKSADEYAESS